MTKHLAIITDDRLDDLIEKCQLADALTESEDGIEQSNGHDLFCEHFPIDLVLYVLLSYKHLKQKYLATQQGD